MNRCADKWISPDLLFFAWVRTSVVAFSRQNELADVKQSTNLIFEFLFLAAVLRGIGLHVWDVQVSQYAEITKVCSNSINYQS